MALMMMMIEDCCSLLSLLSSEGDSSRSPLSSPRRVVVGRITRTVYVVIEYSFVEI